MKPKETKGKPKEIIENQRKRKENQKETKGKPKEINEN